jgi:hypothetical protein
MAEERRDLQHASQNSQDKPPAVAEGPFPYRSGRDRVRVSGGRLGPGVVASSPLVWLKKRQPMDARDEGEAGVRLQAPEGQDIAAKTAGDVRQ